MGRDSRTEYQRSRILAAIATDSMTTQQLADRLHLSRGATQLHLTAMMTETPRRVHISGFAQVTFKSKGAPMYLAGDKEDAKYVKVSRLKGRISARERKQQILKRLAIANMSGTELVESTGLQRARVYIAELYAAGKIHIGGWRPSLVGGSPIQLYAKGHGSDVQKPPRQSEHEKRARYWAKLKSDPHRHGMYLLTARLRKKPQSVFAALGI